MQTDGAGHLALSELTFRRPCSGQHLSRAFRRSGNRCRSFVCPSRRDNVLGSVAQAIARAVTYYESVVERTV